jgi:Outer membrane protein beta-barrel domain
MHENNFEKQVREKMDQLGFDPSDAVWSAVDRELNKEKKRRVPLFWLFLFSGLVLAGGVYYYSANKNAAKQMKLIGQPLNPGIKPDKKSGTIVKSGSSSDQDEGTANSKLPAATTRVISKQDNSKKGTRLRTDQQKKTNLPVDKNPDVRQQKNSYTEQKKNPNTEQGKNPAPEKEENPEVEKNNNSNAGKTEPAGALVAAGVEKKQTETQPGKENGPLKDSIANKNAVVPVENKVPKDSASTVAQAKKKDESKKSSPWKFGVTGTAGFSNANEDLFKPLYGSAQANYSVNSPSANPTSGGPASYTPSSVDAGFSFSLGGFVNRSFSKTVSISAGLGYHYYSTKTSTGSFVNSSIYFYLPSGGINYIASYYSNGKYHAHTNQYHFVELPVTVNFKLNKSNHLPIIWEAGFSLSYLAGSDAVAYDPVSGIYYKSSGYMNKFQFNGITALMVGLPVGKSALQLGPQLQYGFTGLLKNSSGNPGHLINYGLKISFIPGKK